MKYQVIVLDLDGTLTNSKKEITPPTRDALIEIQQNGKKVVLASGRPINGVAPLAEELYLKEYGGFMLSFNGARITRCSDNAIIYNKVIPQEVIRPIYEAVKEYPGLDLISYTDKVILSGIKSNEYTEKEAAINSMDICPVEDFPAALDFPVNKMLIPGEPSILEDLMPKLQKQYHGLLNIYRSEPFFLEIMPQNIDKAHSLQKLLNSIGLTADSMICCGDGFNDLSMIEYAGLGVAMENAQPVVKESADFITKSNDEDGILHVVNLYMRDYAFSPEAAQESQLQIQGHIQKVPLETMFLQESPSLQVLKIQTQDLTAEMQLSGLYFFVQQSAKYILLHKT